MLVVGSCGLFESWKEVLMVIMTIETVESASLKGIQERTKCCKTGAQTQSSKKPSPNRHTMYVRSSSAAR